MRLQANYNGAWKNVALPPDLHKTTDVELLKTVAVERRDFARGLRILDEALVIWLWDAERGWHEPHWVRP